MFNSLKKKEDKPPLFKLNINWGLVWVLLGVGVLWLVVIYFACQLIMLKGEVGMYKSNQAYEQIRILKAKNSIKVAAFREKSGYGDYQIKIMKEIIKVCEEQGFKEWKLAVAIAKLETQLGTKVVGRNNLYNIKRTKYTYRNYSTIKDSILDFINLLNTSHYYKEFHKSRKLKDLFNYAEDPKWEWKVQNIMNKL